MQLEQSLVSGASVEAQRSARRICCAKKGYSLLKAEVSKLALKSQDIVSFHCFWMTYPDTSALSSSVVGLFSGRFHLLQLCIVTQGQDLEEEVFHECSTEGTFVQGQGGSKGRLGNPETLRSTGHPPLLLFASHVSCWSQHWEPSCLQESCPRRVLSVPGTLTLSSTDSF